MTDTTAPEVTSPAPLPSCGAAPVIEGGWVRPASGGPAEPRWGFADGIQLGLHPLPGPRGLLRIFTPYLGQPRERVLNFVAIEPIVDGGDERGLSELESSLLDSAPGKRFWSSNSLDATEPVDPLTPAAGIVDEADGVERLTVYVHSERFDNGAEVSVRVRFRADRPHEVALATFKRDGSAPLDACVLTATMGNYARLRRLHLRDRVVQSTELWPHYSGSGYQEGFADHAVFRLDALTHSGGAAIVAATPDETDPASAAYGADVLPHWHYIGARAVQGWRVDDPHADMVVQVNGRNRYWASSSDIPGGISYENFEIVEPFRSGAEYTFWVEPLADDADLAGAIILHQPDGEEG